MIYEVGFAVSPSVFGHISIQVVFIRGVGSAFVLILGRLYDLINMCLSIKLFLYANAGAFELSKAPAFLLINSTHIS